MIFDLVLDAMPKEHPWRNIVKLVEEAIRRMESGEDPDKIEEEMGDLLDAEDPLLGEPAGGRLRNLSKKLRPPNVDDTLYDL